MFDTVIHFAEIVHIYLVVPSTSDKPKSGKKHGKKTKKLQGGNDNDDESSSSSSSDED